MASNPQFLLLSRRLFLLTIISLGLTAHASSPQTKVVLGKSFSGWGVEEGDVLTYSIQIRLDGQDLLQQVVYRKPLVARIMIMRTPYVPRYFHSDQGFAVYPEMQIIGYFHGTLSDSAIDFSEELVEISQVAVHPFFLEGSSVVHPSFLDYMAKNVRSGYTDRSVNPESGDVWEIKYEYSINYFRIIYKGESADNSIIYNFLIEYSRQDGIAKELQIRLRTFYDIEIVESSGVEPGFHTTEEQVEFLKKESGYIHGGSSDIEPLILLATLGLAFALGTISGIRMRRFRAQKSS